MKKQRGVSLSGLIVTAFVFIIVALLGMKVGPEVVEYFQILKNAKAVAADPSSRGVGVSDIRKAFERRAVVDNISAITPQDLEITKEGSEIVISFAYAKKIPLFGPVSLLIDFEGSTSK